MATFATECPVCGTLMRISDDIERLICTNCGASLAVQKGEGYLSLKRLEAAKPSPISPIETGQGPFRRATTSQSAPPPKPVSAVKKVSDKKTTKNRTLLIVILGVFVVCCVLPGIVYIADSSLRVAGFLPTYTARPIRTQIASAVPQKATEPPDSAILPANSPEPVAINTSEPIATKTPLPLAPSCKQINITTEGMTDVQWDKYKKDFPGQWVDNWEGTVTEVSNEFLGSGYNIHVNFVGGCDILVTIKDEVIALSYSRGDQVIVSGETLSISEMFDKLIVLNTDTATITKK